MLPLVAIIISKFVPVFDAKRWTNERECVVSVMFLARGTRRKDKARDKNWGLPGSFATRREACLTRPAWGRTRKKGNERRAEDIQGGNKVEGRGTKSIFRLRYKIDNIEETVYRVRET
jgi:hypothetical protein